MSRVPPPNEDLAELAGVLGDDNVRTLIGTFLREYPLLLQQLAEGDRRTRHRLAHSLKSNARVVGARPLSARMAELESRLSTPTGADVQPSELAEITRDFDRVAQQLRTWAAQTG